MVVVLVLKEGDQKIKKKEDKKKVFVKVGLLHFEKLVKKKYSAVWIVQNQRVLESAYIYIYIYIDIYIYIYIYKCV